MRAGTIKTSFSGAKDAVLHTQIHRRGQETTGTCNSGHKVAVLKAQKHRMRAGTH